MADELLVSHSDLQGFVSALFKHLGLPAADADVCAADLVQTNLWGIDSHGILRLPVYAKRIQNGAINKTPNIRRLGGRGGMEVWDGDGGFGFIVGHRATERAIELAVEHGVGFVTIRNSNHFGAAGLYIKQATEAGMLAIATTNVEPNLVAPGGAKPITGNNPVAFGAPTGLEFPMILDISMSAVAGGKLLLAQEKGEKIPFGWATDREGKPTDDPYAGFKGFLLPLGGHKGFGLSLMVEILSGVLSGGAYQFGLENMYSAPEVSSGTSHTFIVIDPGAFLGLDKFESRMQDMYATLKQSPMWDPKARMLLPGEMEHETMHGRRQNGLPIPASLMNEVSALAEAAGLAAPDLILA